MASVQTHPAMPAEAPQLSTDTAADPPQAEAALYEFSKRSVDAQPGTWEANQTETPEVSKEAYQTIPLMNWPQDCHRVLPMLRPQDPFQG